jgi:hypothetical protein
MRMLNRSFKSRLEALERLEASSSTIDDAAAQVAAMDDTALFAHVFDALRQRRISAGPWPLLYGAPGIERAIAERASARYQELSSDSRIFWVNPITFDEAQRAISALEDGTAILRQWIGREYTLQCAGHTVSERDSFYSFAPPDPFALPPQPYWWTYEPYLACKAVAHALGIFADHLGLRYERAKARHYLPQDAAGVIAWLRSDL